MMSFLARIAKILGALFMLFVVLAFFAAATGVFRRIILWGWS